MKTHIKKVFTPNVNISHCHYHVGMASSYCGKVFYYIKLAITQYSSMLARKIPVLTH